MGAPYIFLYTHQPVWQKVQGCAVGHRVVLEGPVQGLLAAGLCLSALIAIVPGQREQRVLLGASHGVICSAVQA